MRNQNKAEEIDFFNKVAKEKIYETINSREIQKIFKIVEIVRLEKLRILDAGSGTGAFGGILAKKNEVIGVDISPEMVKKANSINENRNFKAIIGDIEDRTLFEKDDLDMIFCGLILHHFPDISKVINNFSCWLKPTGKIIIVETNGSNPVKKFSRMISDILRIINQKWFIDNCVSTLNETDHSLKKYLQASENKGFEPYRVESYPDPSPFPKLKSIGNMLMFLNLIKRTLYKIFWVLLPAPYNGALIIILAKKKRTSPN